MKFNIVVLGLFLLITPQLIAQEQTNVTTFSRQSLLFIEEMEQYLGTVDIRDKNNKKVFDGKKTVDVFKEQWENSLYSSEQQEEIYTIANLILQANLSPFPDMANFIRSLTAFPSSSQDTESFMAWATVIKDKLQNSNTQQDAAILLYRTHLLLNENTISVVKAIRWKTEGLSYSFVNRDNELIIDFNDLAIQLQMYEEIFTISNTKGTIDLLHRTIEGDGGFVYWDRYLNQTTLGQKFSRDYVWAELSHYTINLQTAIFNAENVHYVNKHFFNHSITGSFTDQVVALTRNNTNLYPDFRSYSDTIMVENILSNFDFRGGVHFYGDNFDAIGQDSTSLGSLHATLPKERSITLLSNKFQITDDFFTTDDCKATIYLHDDSISHPSQNVRYDVKTNTIDLVCGTNVISEVPYINSYQNIEIKADAMKWKLDDSVIMVTHQPGIENTSIARFISNNNFGKNKFDQIQGIDKYNPINVIYDLYKDLGEVRQIKIDLLVDAYQLETNQIIFILIELAADNFLSLDYAQNAFTIYDKLLFYAEAANEETDYDNIEIFSNPAKNNAKLFLNSMNLVIDSVKSVVLSDSQMVVAIPSNNKINMERNRNFIFSGKALAGMFDLYFSRTSAYFNYDQFTIDMPSVDSLILYVVDSTVFNQEYNEYASFQLRSVIEYLKAKLYIDYPTNKSGIKESDSLAYLKADTTKLSAVYYVDATFPNSYPKDRFAYKVYPFHVKNISEFSTQDFYVAGKLESDGIIPNLEDSLRIREDLSLGFFRDTPQNGYPLYNNKGNLKGKIDLSLMGLRGEGELNFLNAQIKTFPLMGVMHTNQIDERDFVFFPDSTVGVAKDLIISESTTAANIPKVDGDSVKISWLPYSDKLAVNSSNGTLRMYNNRFIFRGIVVLTPTQLTGDGLGVFDNAELTSKDYTFLKTNFKANNADFKIRKINNPSIFSFLCTDYNAAVDFSKDRGTFLSNQSSGIEFPLNQFRSTLLNFDWDIKKRNIELYAQNEIYAQLMNLSNYDIIELYNADGITGPELISTNSLYSDHPLRFFSYSASFSQHTNELKVHEVPFIQSGDLYVFPKDGKLLIEENNMEIYIDSSQLLTVHDEIIHEFNDAIINLRSAVDYTAPIAYYNYYDRLQQLYKLQFTDFSFERIELENQTIERTEATSEVKRADDFKISPEFDFDGLIKFKADRLHFGFDGYLYINGEQCEETTRIPAISFDTIVDPASPLFPINSTTRSDQNFPVFCGMKHVGKSKILDVGFLKEDKFIKDTLIFSASGFLKYDVEQQLYGVADKQVWNDKTDPGSIMYFDPKKCNMHGSGPFNFDLKISKSFTLDAYASFTSDMDGNNIALNANLILDFKLPNSIRRFITDTIANCLSAPSYELQKRRYAKFLTYTLGNIEKSTFIGDLTLGEAKVPTNLDKQFVFTDVNLSWDPDQNIWHSAESVMGLGVINNTLITRLFDAYIEIEKGSPNDAVRFLIFIENGDYFYFSFEGNRRVRTYSSIAEYNILVESKKEGEKSEESEEKGGQVSLLLEEREKIQQFLTKSGL